MTDLLYNSMQGFAFIVGIYVILYAAVYAGTMIAHILQPLIHR